MSFHHVRALHGSAMNTSNRPRNLLLYEVAASDAWPLMGVKDFDEFNSRLLTGDRVIAPRLTDVPVRHAAAAAETSGIDLRDPIGVEEMLLHPRSVVTSTSPAAPKPRAMRFKNQNQTKDTGKRMTKMGADGAGSSRLRVDTGGKHRLSARMVRLLPLRHRRGAGVRRTVLPEERSGRRHPALLPDLRRRFRVPTVGRHHLRYPWRSLWPQARIGRNAADDRSSAPPRSDSCRPILKSAFGPRSSWSRCGSYRGLAPAPNMAAR